MKGVDLMKGSIIWIILASMFLYAALILFSDVSEISEQFIHIRIELVFLVLGIGVLSHIIRIFRQNELRHMVNEKISEHKYPSSKYSTCNFRSKRIG